MPLRQSTLSFGRKTMPAALLASAADTANLRLSDPPPSSLPKAEADTIVVDTSDANLQLPTPSASATDVSSQDGSVGNLDEMPRSRSKRVSVTRRSRFQESIIEHPGPDQIEKNRSISGETLVNGTAASALLENSIEALNLPWSINGTLDKGSKLENSQDSVSEDDDAEVGSTVVLNPAADDEEEEEDEAERAAKVAARKVKAEQNAKKWEERRKAAEKNATRKSGRASMLVKAGKAIAEASKVLGKRSRDVIEHGADKLHQLKSSLKTNLAPNTAEEPAAKKARVTEDDMPQAAPVAKKPVNLKGKKWLASGLYAGQIRNFDARLTESSNKRKSHVKTIEQSKENSVLPLPMFAGERLLKHGRDFKLPFDIYAPPPPGQAKPDGWKKCNKNVFVGDAADVWRANKHAEHSTCYCRPETGCDHNCMNRYMYYECDENNCNLSYNQCGNRQWEQLKRRTKLASAYTVGVDVVKTKDRGHGVRANRTFEPNQLIVEYAGEIITQEECERRMRTIYKDNECYYLMLFDQNMILDATRGSVARFVNHSCEPNCRMEKWTVDGKPRMALFAGEAGVMTGEELTYDYNFDPYSQKNVQVCRCGSEKCRGILGPKPKEVKQKSPDIETTSKRSEPSSAGAKRKVAEVVEDNTSRLGKKRKTEGSSKAVKKLTKGDKKTGKSTTPKKLVAVKGVLVRKVSTPKTTARAAKRSPSKLKKMIAETRAKALPSKGKRIISTGSAAAALLDKSPKEVKSKKQSLSRSLSLKDKATSIKKTVVRSLKGRSRGASFVEIKA